MNIRVATTNDLDQIALLFIEQFDIQSELQPYLMQSGAQDRQFIEDTLTNSNSEIFVAEEANKAIGFVSVYERKTSDFDFMVKRKYAYLMDIIITKDENGKGYATQLMNVAKEWAKSRKLDYIELSVAANNSAVDFYLKSGYEEVGKTMMCKLG